MPKKSKTLTKQAKGWITRRARLVAARKHDQPNPIGIIGALDRSTIMRNALNAAPTPKEVIGVQPQRHDFAGEIVLAARKKGGAEAVQKLLEQCISTVVTDIRDEAWQMHHRIEEDREVRRRNRVISDFLVMSKQHSAQITVLGSTTMQAIVEALEEAGYTARGRIPNDTKATDAAAVR